MSGEHYVAIYMNMAYERCYRERIAIVDFLHDLRRTQQRHPKANIAAQIAVTFLTMRYRWN